MSHQASTAPEENLPLIAWFEDMMRPHETTAEGVNDIDVYETESLPYTRLRPRKSLWLGSNAMARSH